MKKEFLVEGNISDDYKNITILGYDDFEIVDGIFSDDSADGLKLEIYNFNKEYSIVNKKIIDISYKLIMGIEYLNINEDVNEITNKVKILDDTIDDIRSSINFLGIESEFNLIFASLVDLIIKIKEKLKTLKILQIVSYEVKTECINNKIDELRKLIGAGIDSSFVDKINGLNKIEKVNFNVTDWKFSKYRSINYEEINKLINIISTIEDDMKLAKISLTEERLAFYKKFIDGKILNINNTINNAVFLDSVNDVRNDLVNLDNLIYSFLTFLCLSKDKISNSQYLFYLEWLEESRRIVVSINNLLIINKKYKNIKEKLNVRLKVINSKIDIFSRFIDIHCMNCNSDIIKIDDEELKSYTDRLEKIINEIECNRSLMVESQYSSLIVISTKMMNKLDEIRSKMNDSFKINLIGMYSINNKLLDCSVNKNNCLKVVGIKSGNKILEKNNKLILISSGLISLILLLRKFLLIPAIMYGNIRLGNIYSDMQHTVLFFNKILSGMIDATMNIDGVWCLNNGSLLNFDVVSTLLLKSLVVGGNGLESSIISSLIIFIKDVVNRIKIKEHKQKIINSIDMMNDKCNNSIKDVIE